MVNVRDAIEKLLFLLKIQKLTFDNLLKKIIVFKDLDFNPNFNPIRNSLEYSIVKLEMKKMINEKKLIKIVSF